MRKYMQRKHFWIVVVYGIFYLICFGWLEKNITRGYHVIHMAVDDWIPFCEVFIIPYTLWFFYIAGTVAFFGFFNKSVQEFYQVVFSLGIGMTLFLVVSLLYPNGQNLRPMVFTRDNIFVYMVRHLYAIDTPTNIFPSIHVYNSVAAYLAIDRCEMLRGKTWIRKGILILTMLIVLSTMFLKQHSMFDVMCALALNAVVFGIVYAPKAFTQTSRDRVDRSTKLLGH